MDAIQTPLAGFVPIEAERASRYREAGHWAGRTLADLILDAAARREPDQVALAGERDHEAVTWGGLVRSVAGMAAGLSAAGIGRGDRLVVQLPNSPPFVVLVLALWRIGAVPVMALPAFREHELGHILDISGASAMAVQATVRHTDHLRMARGLRDGRPALRLLLVAGAGGGLGDGEADLEALTGTPAAGAPAGGPDADDVAVMLLSGGTTGLPKLIPRTHDDYAYNLRISADICGLDERTVYLAALPVAHNFALGCPGVMGTLLRGGRAVFVSSPASRAVLAAVARHRVTLAAAVPPLAMQWGDSVLEEGARPESLELLQVGGSRLLPEAARRLRRAFGCRIQQVYGMAEGLLNFTRPGDPDEVVVETQGRPASPDDELRIVGEDGREVGPGEVGELLTRGPYTIRGYFRAASHNAGAFTPDGFFRTGDLVRWHPSGNLCVEGRVKDVINRGGEKIAAAELENLVLGHPAVSQVAAVAQPEPTLGEAICVCAVLRPGHSLSLSELRTFLAGLRVARFKLPDRLEVVDELPVTPVGKVDKALLRRRVASSFPGPARADGTADPGGPPTSQTPSGPSGHLLLREGEGGATSPARGEG